MTATAQQTENNLFTRIGGSAAIDKAVDIFYRKVLSDDRIAHFFDGVDMDKKRAKQKGFLTFAFGGPNNYTGRDTREGHKHLVAQGLNDMHFDAVVENLATTLTELGVSHSDIQEVENIAESVRDDVLNR